MVKHLYFHIPFCPHICPYCAFHVIKVDRLLMERFADLLLKEYELVESDLDLETIYFGGGTPTALSTKMLDRILARVRCSMGQRELEVTMECNPSTLSLEKAKLLSSHGVNRLSIGAQSLDGAVLQTLGRTHSVRAVEECIQTARAVGLSNLNLDLMFGVPGQSFESWKETLRRAVSLQPEHLSCYGLTYEEDTDFFLQRKMGRLQTDPELEAEMFRFADRYLESEGYEHYEISNYAKPGFRSRHNLAYWRGNEYYGMGPSAVSTVRGVRRTNSRWSEHGWSPESEEFLSETTLAAERMMLELRLKEGVDEERFEGRFRFSPRHRWKKEIETLVEAGMMLQDPRLCLTPAGRILADEVAVYFCPPESPTPDFNSPKLNLLATPR